MYKINNKGLRKFAKKVYTQLAENVTVNITDNVFNKTINICFIFRRVKNEKEISIGFTLFSNGSNYVCRMW